MGLSDEERIHKLYAGITSLCEIAKDLDPKDDYAVSDKIADLKSLTSNLWHAFLGGRRNGTYWILGGDADAPIKSDSRGPWGAAILRHLPVQERSKEQVEHDEAVEKFKRENFNPFDGVLDLASLLGHARKTYKHVYDLYQTTEFCAYALRRYDDDLSASLESLSKIISDIQGVCHAIFAKDETFAKAYVLERVCRLVFCGTRRAIFPDDVGKKMLSDVCLHHDVSRPMSRGTLAEVVAIDKMLGKSPTDVDRVVAALRLSGSRFHYDHQFKKLVELFGESSRERLAPEFAACKKSHDDEEKASRERYADDAARDEQQAIHGWDGWEDDEPAKPKSEKKPPTKRSKARKGKKS